MEVINIIVEENSYNILKLLTIAKICKSYADAKRLVFQGQVSVNDEILNGNNIFDPIEIGKVLKIICRNKTVYYERY